MTVCGYVTERAFMRFIGIWYTSVLTLHASLTQEKLSGKCIQNNYIGAIPDTDLLS